MRTAHATLCGQLTAAGPITTPRTARTEVPPLSSAVNMPPSRKTTDHGMAEWSRRESNPRPLECHGNAGATLLLTVASHRPLSLRVNGHGQGAVAGTDEQAGQRSAVTVRSLLGSAVPHREAALPRAQPLTSAPPQAETLLGSARVCRRRVAGAEVRW